MNHVLLEENRVKQNYIFKNWYPKLFTGAKTLEIITLVRT